MTISIRRFSARPSSSSLLATGRVSPKLAALTRSAGISASIMVCTTVSARALASTQLEGYCEVAIGTLSV